MGKTRLCIDCEKNLFHMSILAKRCRNCKRKFMDKCSYDIKKIKRAKDSKEKVLVKIEKIGASNEVAEKVKEKIANDLSPKTKFGYLNSSLYTPYPNNSSDNPLFGEKDINKIIEEKIKKRVKEELEKEKIS